MKPLASCPRAEEAGESEKDRRRTTFSHVGGNDDGNGQKLPDSLTIMTRVGLLDEFESRFFPILRLEMLPRHLRRSRHIEMFIVDGSIIIVIE